MSRPVAAPEVVGRFHARDGSRSLLGQAAEWIALADRAGAVPFLRPEWVLPWWSAFGRGRLELVGIRDGPRLRAAVPLAGHGRRLRSPTNWHTPVFGAVAEAGPWMAQLADGMFDRAPRQVVLDLVAAGEPTHRQVVEAARRHGYWVAASLRQRSPVLTLAGGWDRYEAGLGHNLRRNVRRHRRRLEEHGLVRLDVHDGPDALDEVLTEAFRLEASGWKGEARSAIDARPATRRFYRDVARLAGDRGWLLLAALRLDGRAVAVDLCLEHAGLHHVVKTAYDESLASLSPGLLLRHEMIRRAFEHGLTRYELLGGTEPWKLAWTQEADDRLRVRALAPGLVTAPERFLRGSDAAPARWLRDRMADRQRDHSLRSGTHRA